MPTLGETISQARKGKGLSQKELASKLIKEDGSPISPQYLNDLERDRRSGPSDHLMVQFAQVLEVDLDVLYNCAGSLAPDLRCVDVPPEKYAQAISAFRRTLKKD